MSKKKSLETWTNDNWINRFKLCGYRQRGTPKMPSFWNMKNTNHNIRIKITIEEIMAGQYESLP